MGLVQSIAGQFARPHGWAARPMAVLLNVANRGVNRATVAALDLQPGEQVLDIGFGGGVGLREALGRVGGDGSVVGVELSPELIQRGRTALRRELAGGRLDLLEGTVDAIPVEDGRFAAAYTINTVYFWPDVERGLREILRVLGPGGRFVLAVQHRAMRGNQRYGGHETPPVERLEELMRTAGFVDVERQEPGYDAVLLLGRKP